MTAMAAAHAQRLVRRDRALLRPATLTAPPNRGVVDQARGSATRIRDR